MEECLISLKSADTLLQSNQKLESLKSSENVQDIAKQIQITKEHLMILGDLPQFESTKQQLIQLQNKLESMAKPLVIHALEEKNNDTIKMLIHLFKQMERETELHEIIFSFYISRISHFWKLLTDKIQQDKTFLQSVSEFYEQYIQLLTTDVSFLFYFSNHCDLFYYCCSFLLFSLFL